MHIKGKYSWVKHLDFLTIDLLSLLVSYFAAFYWKFHRPQMSPEWTRYVLIIVLVDIIIYLSMNPYSGFFRRRYYHELGRTFIKIFSNAICATLIFYVLKIGADYSREVFLCTYSLYYLISVALKYVWKKLLVSGKAALYSTKKITIFLISDITHADRAIHSIYSIDLPLYEIVGVHFVDADNNNSIPNTLTYQDSQHMIHIPVIKENYVKYILDNNVDGVLVAVNPNLLEAGVLQTITANGVEAELSLESLLGVQTEEQFITNIGVTKTLSIGTFSFSPKQKFYLLVKRLFDILCGLIGIVVLIPVTIIVKSCYLLTGDTARIFYRQRRVGLNGKLIYIWKFRSMVPNAPELLEELLKNEKYRKEWEENQKLENDPRITKIGAALRKTSIDELPQLINVLRGDMSLVGPRPLVVGELEAHGGLKLYERVKPGITGWWGCNGRSNINYRERLELEYYYVRNCSLYLDILCIIRTIWAVLQKDGAQ